MKRKREDGGGSNTKLPTTVTETNSNDSSETKLQKMGNDTTSTSLPVSKTTTVYTDKSNSLHDGMFLRLTYWLNSSLTKAINAGLYSVHNPKLYEPCVVLTNTNKKVFCVPHSEWNAILLYVNEVSAYIEKKEKKTIFIPQEECIVAACTIRPLFGKVYVTFFTFDNDIMSSPFVLTGQEWDMMIMCLPNINSHLNKLTHDTSVINEYVQREQTTLENASDIQASDRLVDELKAFARS